MTDYKLNNRFLVVFYNLPLPIAAAGLTDSIYVMDTVWGLHGKCRKLKDDLVDAIGFCKAV